MGKIYFIMGKSSSGKDTFYRKLLSDKRLKLKPVVGYTTRPIRTREKQGREYHFVDIKELAVLEAFDKVIERRDYDTVYGVWSYFTVDDGSIKLEKLDYLYIGTIESFMKISEYYGRENVVPIYIDVDDGIRLERALRRERKQAEPKYAEMCRRFIADSEDFSEEKIKEAEIYKKYNNDHTFNSCYEKIVEDIRRK